MNDTLTEKWLKERNIILEKSFTKELQSLATVYKKQCDSAFE